MFYLIAQFIQNGFDEIYFALPNDELKYYDIKDYNFQAGILEFLSHQNVSLIDNTIKINISSFKFSKSTHHRPYNMGNKIVDILTHDMLM